LGGLFFAAYQQYRRV
ncbi:MAG: cytochrome b6-f complex subunit PetG, partial [Pseudanabaena sp.]